MCAFGGLIPRDGRFLCGFGGVRSTFGRVPQGQACLGASFRTSGRVQNWIWQGRAHTAMPLPVGPKSELKPSGGQMRRRERGLELHVARAGRIRRVRFVGDDDTRRASSTRATRRARLWRGRNCDNRGVKSYSPNTQIRGSQSLARFKPKRDARLSS